MSGDMLSTPGFAHQTPQVQRRLWDIAQAHGWPVDSLIAAVEHESGWDPKARNPTSSATGLLQWIESTAQRMYGLTTKQIHRLSALEQLELAEQYWAAVNARNPLREWDFLAAGLGVGHCPPGPLEDTCVMYAPGTAGAAGNPTFQDPFGAITVGNVRDYTRAYFHRFADRPRLPVPDVKVSPRPVPSASASSLSPLPWLLVVAGAGGAFYLFTRRRHGK